MKIQDMTETNLLNLRRDIYLTLKSSLDHEEAAHKIMKQTFKPGQEVGTQHTLKQTCRK